MSSNSATVISPIKRVGFSENKKKNVKGATSSGAVVALKSPSGLSWQQAVDSKKNLSDVNTKQMS